MVLLRTDLLALQNCEFSLSGQRGVFVFCTLYFSSSLESTVIYFCDKAVTTGGSHCWDEFGCQGYTVSAEKHVLSTAQQKAAPDRCLMLPGLGSVFSAEQDHRAFAGLPWVLCLQDGSLQVEIIP